jgi:hypothetical protein
VLLFLRGSAWLRPDTRPHDPAGAPGPGAHRNNKANVV